jgi:hypothetical protein
VLYRPQAAKAVRHRLRTAQENDHGDDAIPEGEWTLTWKVPAFTVVMTQHSPGRATTKIVELVGLGRTDNNANVSQIG